MICPSKMRMVFFIHLQLVVMTFRPTWQDLEHDQFGKNLSKELPVIWEKMLKYVEIQNEDHSETKSEDGQKTTAAAGFSESSRLSIC